MTVSVRVECVKAESECMYWPLIICKFSSNSARDAAVWSGLGLQTQPEIGKMRYLVFE